jgi:hypothetical protein
MTSGVIKMKAGTYQWSSGITIVGGGQDIALHGDGATVMVSGAGLVQVKDGGRLSVIGLAIVRQGAELVAISTDFSGGSTPTLSLTRTTLEGTGLTVSAGKVTIRQSMITMNEPGGVRFGRVAINILFSNGLSKVVVDRSRFVDTTGSSFAAIGSYDTSLEVTNSIFSGFALDVAHSSDANGGGRENTDISFSTFLNTPANCGSGSTATRIYSNNIWYLMTGGDAGTGDACSHHFDLMYPQTGIVPRGDHIVVADPRFEDAANGDLRLRIDSPAVDAADPASPSVAKDFAGTSRPQGLRRDIGAFERKAGNP